MKLLAIAAILAVAAPAAAQSKRYPPEPVDKDDEAARKSKLWDAATNPHRTPYESLLALAQQGLDERTSDGWQEAAKKLDDAVKLMPDDGRAYSMRGEAHRLLKLWPKCAADFAAAWARARTLNLTAKTMGDLRANLGVCQARAGKLGDAERTLAEAAVTGSASSEVWMRLGEVRIALGKLEEAIAALEAATEAADAQQALVRWLLAGAYDRARRPAEALDSARRALSYDRQLTTLDVWENGAIPPISLGESAYLMGLANTAMEVPRSEYALAYFRKFVRVAPTSPWRKRAEDHIRELRTSELPDAIERTAGNAPLDLVVARGIIRKSMAGLRACVAKLPTTVFGVDITRSGPRTPTAARERPKLFAPPDGVVTVLKVIPGEATRAEIDAAIRCIDPVASRLPLPAVKERDAWYKVSFFVGAP